MWWDHPTVEGRRRLDGGGESTRVLHLNGILSADDLKAERFCVHGVWGGPCGNGICLNSMQCVCDEGYVHDSSLFYYPNCFTPQYMYPVLGIIGGVTILIVLATGVSIARRAPEGPAKQVAVDVSIYAVAFLLLVLSIQLEGRMAMLSDLGNGICIVLLLGRVIPSSLDLYLSPGLQFLPARVYAQTKKRLMYLSFGMAFFYLAICFEAERRLWAEHDLKGSNNIRGGLYLFAALFCLVSALVFHATLRKMISALGKNSNGDHNAQHASSSASAAEGGMLTSQAQEHRNRVMYAQKMLLTVLLLTGSSDVAVATLHFWFQVFPYQYLLYMGVMWGSPLSCLSILWLVNDHIGRTGVNRVHDGNQGHHRGTQRSGEAPAAVGFENVAESGVVYRGARTSSRRRQSSTYARDADSGASGFSLTL